MADNIYELGEIVKATAGRDKGKLFIVMGIIDDSYVWIANGKNRTIDRPKKKKTRHLKAAGASDYQIKTKILNDKKVFDSEINKILESFGYKEEGG